MENKLFKKIFKSYYNPLSSYLESSKFIKLFKHVNYMYKIKNMIPEKKSYIFRPFNMSDFNKLKVVMLFSTPTNNSLGVPLALPYEYCVKPSKELDKFVEATEKQFHNGLDLNFNYSFNNYLEQGVLMLNTSLTKTKKENHNKLWYGFIIEVIKAIEIEKTGIIFVIMDKSGKRFIKYINKSFHFVLEDYTLYDNDKEFTGEVLKKINNIIEEQNGKSEIINW